MATARIYGKTVKMWYETDHLNRNLCTQVEVEYRDIDEHGNTLARGTEDFSLDRLNKQVQTAEVWTWKGRYNDGGKRWFEFECGIKYRKGDGRTVKAALVEKYGATSELVQLRTI